MQVKMKMPDLATADSAVKVLRWLVEPGQPIQRGQPLLEIETDKAAMEVECVATGVLTGVHAQPDEEVAVGQLIATIEVQAPLRRPETPGPRPAAGPAPAAPAAPAAPPPRIGGMFARNRAARPAAPEQPAAGGEGHDPA